MNKFHWMLAILIIYFGSSCREQVIFIPTLHQELLFKSTQNLNAIYFINSQKGFAVGDSGVIHKTLNGGKTWTSIDSFSVDFYNITFPSNSVGYISGISVFGNLLLRTNDGGETWTTLSTNKKLKRIDFQTIDTGFAISGSDVLMTMNGGKTWKRSILPASVFIPGELAFSSWRDGVITDFDDNVYYTFSAGNVWTQANIDGSYNIRDIAFYDSNNGCAVDIHGVVYITSDGGVNWNSVSGNDLSNDGHGLETIHMVSPSIFYVSGPNTLAFTDDKGTSWTQYHDANGLSIFYNDMQFIDSKNGYGVLSKNIYRITRVD